MQNISHRVREKRKNLKFENQLQEKLLDRLKPFRPSKYIAFCRRKVQVEKYEHGKKGEKKRL